MEFLEGLQTLHADAEAAGECEASADFLAQLAQRLEGRGQDEVFDADGLALVDDASEVLAVRLAHLLEDVDLNSQHGLHGRLLLHLRLLSSLKEKQHLGDAELSLVILDLVDRVYPRGLHFEGLLDCVFLELLSLKEEGGEGEEGRPPSARRHPACSFATSRTSPCPPPSETLLQESRRGNEP